MDVELIKSIKITSRDAQYDKSAKRLLGQKIILAHILSKTVYEFIGMEPEKIVPYIEGDPYISVVPMEPGVTNLSEENIGSKIVGMNTEDSEISEGIIRFDIIFYVRMKNGLSQMIINVEAQKDEPSNYEILNRAIFYTSRMISSQKERDFVDSKYDDIKQVYSIWVCMNVNENCMNHICLTDNCLLGNHHWKGRLELFNIVMIGLSSTLPEPGEKYELHRLLGALLSKWFTVEEKLDIISKEFNISVDNDFKEDMWVMCNLSQGIKEEGIAIGEARGEAIGETKTETRIVLNMHRNGFSIEQIAVAINKGKSEVEAIIHNN